MESHKLNVIRTMTENPYRRKCYLCDNEDDLRVMRRFNGNYYHKKKTNNFSKSCLQAAKDAKKKH